MFSDILAHSYRGPLAVTRPATGEEQGFQAERCNHVLQGPRPCQLRARYKHSWGFSLSPLPVELMEASEICAEVQQKGRRLAIFKGPSLIIWGGEAAIRTSFKVEISSQPFLQNPSGLVLGYNEFSVSTNLLNGFKGE